MTINWNNIDAGYFYLILKIIFIFKCFFLIFKFSYLKAQRPNFEIMKNSDTMGFAYDYNSIMHYEATAFSNNGQPTMVPKQAGVVLKNASLRTALSPIDAAEVKTLYKCA